MSMGPWQLLIVLIVLGVPIAVIATIIAIASKKRSKTKKEAENKQ